MDAGIKVEKTTDEKKVDVDELFLAFKSEIEGSAGAKKAPGDAAATTTTTTTDATEDTKIKVEAEQVEEKPGTSEEKPDPLLDEFYSEVRLLAVVDTL